MSGPHPTLAGNFVAQDLNRFQDELSMSSVVLCHGEESQRYDRVNGHRRQEEKKMCSVLKIGEQDESVPK
jgi:hypothetical protein